jgi:hypothetical protein
VGRAFGLLIWIALILAGVILLIVFAAAELKNGEASTPEVLLPLIVIAGVIALLATLAVAAALYGLFDISDKSQALGLPAGSVQAVIALSLILIFAVVALYASSSSGAERFTSSGLTEAEFQTIPSSEIVASTVKEEEGSVTYDVVRSIEDPTKKDINIQLLTTVSTLVIAVAGFYFGSKSVQEGSKAAIEAAGPNRSLTVTPSSPHTMEAAEQLEVKLQSVPSGAQLNWTLHDDPQGRLLRNQSGEFVYEPGEDMPGSGKSANLIFEQVEDPSTSAPLIINFPKAEGEKVAPEPTPPESKPNDEDDARTQHERAAERQERLKAEMAKRPSSALRPKEPPEPPASAPPESTD